MAYSDVNKFFLWSIPDDPNRNHAIRERTELCETVNRPVVEDCRLRFTGRRKQSGAFLKGHAHGQKEDGKPVGGLSIGHLSGVKHNSLSATTILSLS
jgi:hypothetical protein